MMQNDLERSISFGWGRNIEYHSLPSPRRPINFPKRHQAMTEVQQLKTVGVTKTVSSQQTSPTTVSPNTIGLPQKLVSLKVTSVRSSPTSKTVTVNFAHNPSDQNYQAVNIYTKTARNQPVLVASGPTSPIRIVAPTTRAPVTIIVQPIGVRGSLPVGTSPSRSVSLL